MEVESSGHRQVTIFGLTKTTKGIVKSDSFFEMYDEKSLTPWAVKEGWTSSIANFCGIAKETMEVQVKYPAEFCIFACGVNAPLEVMRDVLKKLTPYAKDLGGNWKLRKEAFEKKCIAAMNKDSTSKDKVAGAGEDDKGDKVVDEESEDDSSSDSDDSDVDAKLARKLRDDDDEPHDLFEPLVLVNGKLPQGMLSGAAASVTGTLSPEVRQLARGINEQNTASYAVLTRIFEVSDIKVLRQATKDYKKRAMNDTDFTLAEVWLGLNANKARGLAIFVEDAVLGGEDPVAVANKLVKTALALKVDIYDNYPITVLTSMIYRIEEALEQLGSPANEQTQISWFVQALKDSPHPLFQAMGIKAKSKAKKILAEAPTGQGAKGSLQKLTQFIRELDKMKAYVPEVKPKPKLKKSNGDDEDGLEDHLANFTDTQPKDLSQIQCWACQKYGHRANTCPQKKTDQGSKGSKVGGKGKSTGKYTGKGKSKGKSHDKPKDNGKGGGGKGKGGGRSNGFAGGAKTTTTMHHDDDDSDTSSEDSSFDYKGRQAAEEEEYFEAPHGEIDDVAVCMAVTKLKQDLRGMKLADGTRRHSKKAVEKKILQYEDDLYSGRKAL